MKKYYTIYKITNIVNNKIYIGKHETRNLDDNYMGSGKHLKYSINKYGIENFTKDTLFIFDNEEEMNNKEAELVSIDFVERKDTYNLCIGGKGGFGYINSTKKNIYGRNGINGLNNLMTGSEVKTLLQETNRWEEYRKKLSNSKKEKYKNGYQNPFKDRTHSDETKAKIGAINSEIQTGKGNSQYGTKWIHNLDLKRSKKIKKEEQVPEGWLLGRKLKFIT